MPRLIIILIFCLSLIETSCDQQPNQKKAKEIAITKIIDDKQNQSNDTAFSKSKIDTAAFGYGEFVSSQYKVQFPQKPLGWVSDFENIFSANQLSELNSILSAFEKETTNEIAVVTIVASWTTKENFDSLTLAIANNWGIGKKEKNNGILIGISKGLRSIRIQNGYGIEEKLTDADTKKILDEIMIPEFKLGNYFEGTKKGLLALMEKIR